MSRGVLLGLIVALLVLVGCGSEENTPSATTQPASTSASTTADPAADPTPKPARRASKLISLERAIGQRLVTGYHGAKPPASVLRAVATGRVGGVILFGENVPTLAAARSAIRALKGAAAAGGQPDLFVMIDQEGGEIKRLPTLPPDVSPAQIGAAKSVANKAKAEGMRTARGLRALGVNVDLAPVADVPAASSSFLGTRAFSRTPAIVARGACGFASGLVRGGVAGTLKHFPGLGRARGNTDLMPITVTADKAALKADLAAYDRCAKDVPMVMIASASYPALGIDGPAVLSGRTYRLLMATGFRGLTISDAFDTPAIANETRPALAALKAGVDLLLYGPDETGAQRAYVRLLADAGDGHLSRSTLRATAARILAFKQALRSGLGR